MTESELSKYINQYHQLLLDQMRQVIASGNFKIRKPIEHKKHD